MMEMLRLMLLLLLLMEVSQVVQLLLMISGGEGEESGKSSRRPSLQHVCRNDRRSDVVEGPTVHPACTPVTGKGTHDALSRAASADSCVS